MCTSRWATGWCPVIAALAMAALALNDRSGIGADEDVLGGVPTETGTSSQPERDDRGYVEPPFVDVTRVSKQIRASEAALRDALATPVTVKFDGEPLEQAVARLAQLTRTRIILDRNSLEPEGVGSDDPVVGEFNEQPLGRILEHLTASPDSVSCLIEDEVIYLAGIGRTGLARHLKFHDADALLDAGFTDRQVIRLVQHATTGPWLETDGFGGEISVRWGLFLVRQTPAVHREVAELLDVFGRVASGDARTGAVPLNRRSGPFQPGILEALSRTVAIDARDTALDQVLADLTRQAGVPIRLDEQTLDDNGIERNEPVTLRIDGVTLKSSLRHLLRPLGLVAIAEEGGLVVLSDGLCMHVPSAVIFVVRDLVQKGIEPDELAALIISQTSDPWENVDGTGGRIEVLPNGLLLVRQTHEGLVEVADLLDQLRQHIETRKDFDPSQAQPSIEHYSVEDLPIQDVAAALPKLVSPDSWKANGGQGDLAAIGTQLVIRQSASVHREVRRFLAECRHKPFSPENFGGAW